ncbi:MAG: type IV pilus assembly protein PilM, partial [Candidatus Staskawiczbacteria bacterium]|nr:type IV pilus assembly protein PilM [Candidatus Staskawiczbacteria bacterium]
PGVVKEGVIQDKESLANIIKMACNTVKGKKLGTKYVIVSLPEEKSFSQLIQMPKMTEEELRLALPFEAENYIPLAIDKSYLDFQIIDAHKKDSKHLGLLVNVMPKSIIDSYVLSFKNAGLIPCVLEVESQAIARALLKNEKTASSVILIDLGYDSTGFIIFSDGSIRFTCSIPISSQQLTNAISDSLGINLHDAEILKVKHGLDKKHHSIDKIIEPILLDLASQIKKYIDFYHGHSNHEYFPYDGKIEKIILSGGGANLKNISDFLSEELKIKVELGNPFSNIIQPKKKFFPPENILSFTAALGLALRGASEQIDN